LTNHLYTIELRFFGAELDISLLTQELTLGSTESLEPRKNFPNAMQRTPVWRFDGEGYLGYQQEWDSFEAGLTFLLSVLKPFKEKIIIASKQHSSIWWCGHFQSSFDGGPTLSSDLLKDLAGYEIPIFIDNYFSQ
jgi:hypothetical protein